MNCALKVASILGELRIEAVVETVVDALALPDTVEVTVRVPDEVTLEIKENWDELDFVAVCDEVDDDVDDNNKLSVATRLKVEENDATELIVNATLFVVIDDCE